MSKPATAEHIDGPARLKPGHTRERTLSVVAGAPKGYTHETWPIALAYHRGKLADGPTRPWHRTYNAANRFQAIEECHDMRQITLRTGTDSTIMDVVTGGGGEPLTQAQADASKKLVSIFSRMATSDRIIVNKLIEGQSLVDAVRAGEGESYRHTIAARVRTALDALIDASDRAKGSGWTFDFLTR